MLSDRNNVNELLKFFENTFFFFLILTFFHLPNISFWFTVNIFICLMHWLFYSIGFQIICSVISFVFICLILESITHPSVSQVGHFLYHWWICIDSLSLYLVPLFLFCIQYSRLSILFIEYEMWNTNLKCSQYLSKYST